MKIRERLLECKVKSGIKSDYALAKALGVPRQQMSELLKGRKKPDAYICVKIGDMLGVHPLILLAELEADNAKTTERRAFWENFGRRIKTGALGMLALISTAFWLPEQKASAGLLDTHNVYYVK
jgi:plasmid maintenance system antidote protein VapI